MKKSTAEQKMSAKLGRGRARGRAQPDNNRPSRGPWRSAAADKKLSEIRKPEEVTEGQTEDVENAEGLSEATKSTTVNILEGQTDDAKQLPEVSKSTTVEILEGQTDDAKQLPEVSKSTTVEILEGQTDDAKQLPDASKSTTVESTTDANGSQEKKLLASPSQSQNEENMKKEVIVQSDNSKSTLCEGNKWKDKSPDEILALSKLSPVALEFSPGLTYPRQIENESQSIEETVEFIYCTLIENPGKFEEVMGVVLPYIEKWISSKVLTQNLVRELLNFASQNPYFGYHAVTVIIRLFDVYKNVKSVHDLLTHAVLSMVLSEADRVLNKLSVDQMTAEEIESFTFKPFLLFLSELYLKFHIGSNRLWSIGLQIITICKALRDAYHLPFNQRVLDISAAIKLAGKSLDEDDENSMNELMESLWSMVNTFQNELQPETVAMFNALSELRDASWGPATTPEEENACGGVDPIQDPQYFEYGVFYGPDGSIITYEEQLFLELSINEESDPYVQGQISPSMDQEMVTAYEEFLQEQVQPSSRRLVNGFSPHTTQN